MDAVTDPRCGKTAGYQAHRRAKEDACAPCLAASAADRRHRAAYDYLTGGQKMTIDATGTRRRIQALVRIGWPLSELADRLGVSLQNVYAYTKRDRVWRSTATKITAIYDELSMTPGPSSSASKRAQSKGWAPPLAYDDDTIDDPKARPSSAYVGAAIDEIAVQRAARGERVRLSRAERAEVVRRLTAAGLSAADIAVTTEEGRVMPKLPCQSGDPDRYFPASGASPKAIAAAKAECAPCPILTECKDWAVRRGESGIWAGTTAPERDVYRRVHGITVERVRMDIVEDEQTDAVRGMVARGFNGPEVARALGISPSGAAQAINRAKRGKAS
jgi:DNA-binding CsgD family transcriptional regulator